MSLNNNPNIEFPELRVVEASAGSGKTYTLAKRYIQLLMRMKADNEAFPLRSILAITFTNKAMHEMRARIISFLKQIALNDFANDAVKDDILASLEINPKLAQEYAYELMDQIIKDYNFFNIQTIDSFVKSLLASSAYEMNLSAGFDIKHDYSQMLEYSLDVCVDESTKNSAYKGFFDSFIDQYLFIENRLGWTPKKDILEILDSLIRIDHSYSGQFKLFYKSMDELKEKKAVCLSKIKLLHENLPDKTNATFRKKLDQFVIEHEHGFDIDSLSKSFAKEKLPLNKGAELNADLESLWLSIRQLLKQICEDEAQTVFNCYIELYQLVSKELRKTVDKHDSLLLGELNKQAKKLFSENLVTIADVYYRISSRFKHYMIDEFQDTSYLRWKNIMPMVEEALSQGGTLFYVGDKKQAIYRFSGGDIRLFDHIAEIFDNYNVKRDVLTTNYRSRAMLVQSNNRLFDCSNIEQMLIAYNDEKKDEIFTDLDRSELLNVFESSRQGYIDDSNGGYVRIEKLAAEDMAEEDFIARKLVELVAELKERFAYSEIAILCRNNKSVEEISSCLLENEIPVASDCTLNIRENHTVKDLMRLLKFLSSPIDDSSLASFILSDLFLKRSGCKREEMENFIFQFKSKRENRSKYLYIAFRATYSDLWTEYFEELFRAVGFVPIYELLITIYDKFKLIELFNGDQGFLMHLLDLLKDSEAEHIDLLSFINYFENSQELNPFVRLAHTNAVSVMTVHKSKGLEFNALVIPSLVMDVKVGSGGSNFEVLGDEDGLSLIKLKKDYANYSEELSQLYKKRLRESFSDELNNVYVALTRPKEELYAFIPPKSGNSRNPARFIIADDIYELGSIDNNREAKVEIEDAQEFLPASVYTDWISKLKNEFKSSNELKSRASAAKGELYHALLENIIKESDIARLGDYGALEQEGVIAKLKLFLDDDKVQRLIFDSEAKIYCEKEFVDSYGNSKRIDRINLYEDRLVLIDYKTKPLSDDSKYIKQIKDYAKLLKDVYPKHSIEAYLLYIEDIKIQKVI